MCGAFKQTFVGGYVLRPCSISIMEKSVMSFFRLLQNSYCCSIGTLNLLLQKKTVLLSCYLTGATNTNFLICLKNKLSYQF